MEAARRQSNGEHEARLVERFTAPSGVRILPKTQDLREFLEVTKRLDHYTLTRLLAEKFSSEDLPTRIKSVTYTLVLLDSGSEASEDYLLDHPDIVGDLYSESLTEFELNRGVVGVNYPKLLVERIEKILTLIGMQDAIVDRNDVAGNRGGAAPLNSQ